MTPSELKYNVEQGPDSFFFTRETMRFFGDTMQNYGVRSTIIPYQWDETGNIYQETPRELEVWELFRRHPVKYGLKDSAYFDKKTYRRVFPPCGIIPAR
jgi:hypothetical protein